MSLSQRSRRKLAEIEQELDGGRTERSLGRLEDMLRQKPRRPEICSLYRRALAARRDADPLDAARRAWLSVLPTEDIEEHVAELESRCATAREVAELLHPPRWLRAGARGSPRERFDALAARLADEGAEAAAIEGLLGPESTAQLEREGHWAMLGCALALLAALAIFVVGLVTVARWLAGLLF